MNANLSLGRVSRTRIMVHWMFLLLFAWIVFYELKRGSNSASILFGITFIFAVFLCEVLNELGHVLMAKRFNIQTEKTTLLPIGGMASFMKLTIS